MRFITANQVFDGSKYLSPGQMLVLDENDKLLNIVKQEEAGENKIESYEGIICPGFVNAHCHLELSHMKGMIEEKTGLVNFAKAIIKKRNSVSATEVSRAIKNWDDFMFRNGIVAVGDICNGPVTFPVKKQSKIFYHSFIELIALNPANATAVLAMGKEIATEAEKLGLVFSFAPHAPYSVSQELMELISKHNSERGQISTIHNQESLEENKFFLGEESDFFDLYRFLNIDISYFFPTGKNSLQSYFSSLRPNKKIMLVHNTFSNSEDINFAEELHKNVYWCLCPNANLYIENRLPDIKMLLDKGVKICIGTDSLASNHSLSITDEMNILLQNVPGLAFETILKWATNNGAGALGIEDKFGTFKKGLNAGINLLKQEEGKILFSQKLA